MGKIPEKIFLKRHTNDQRVCEKNAQNHKSLGKCKPQPQWSIISPQLEWLLSKRPKKKKSWHREREALRHCWWECKSIQPLGR
jgi:hypothetical protein